MGGSYPPEPGRWIVFAGGPAWQAITCNKKQVSALERFLSPLQNRKWKTLQGGGWGFGYPQEPGWWSWVCWWSCVAGHYVQ